MLKKTLALAIGLSGAQMALAQGFYVDEQSALRLGDAFSGGAAQANDPSTAFYNPAGLTRLQERQLSANLSGIYAQSEFDGTATTLSNAPVAGEDAEASSFSAIPSIYFSAPMSEKMVFGAYLNAPFATGTDFGDDTIARYQATESSITGIDFGTAFGFKVTDDLSLGLSMVMQYISATVAQSVNTSALCLAAEANGDFAGTTITCDGLGMPASELGATSRDAQFEMKGDDLAIGFTAGALYEFSDDARLGIHYRNRIAHNLQGTATLDVPTAAEGFGSLAGLTDAEAAGTAKLNTPEQANISYFHQLGQFSVQADVQWTKWSRFETLQVVTQDPVIGAVATPQTYDWEESMRYAIGAAYQLNQNITLRTGVALDETPIPDEQTKIDFAFDNYQAVSFGMSYDINDDIALDFAIQKTLKQERDVQQGSIADPNQNLAQLDGKVSNDITSVATGLRWKF